MRIKYNIFTILYYFFFIYTRVYSVIFGQSDENYCTYTTHKDRIVYLREILRAPRVAAAEAVFTILPSRCCRLPQVGKSVDILYIGNILCIIYTIKTKYLPIRSFH